MLSSPLPPCPTGPLGSHSACCLPQLLESKNAVAPTLEPKLARKVVARTAQAQEESLKELEAAERERIALAGVEVPPEKRKAIVEEYWARAEQEFLDAALASARRSLASTNKGSESSTGLGRRPDPASIRIIDGKVTVKRPSLLRRLFRGSSRKVILPLCLALSSCSSTLAVSALNMQRYVQLTHLSALFARGLYFSQC